MKQKILLFLLGSLLSLSAMARDFTYTYERQTLTYTVIDEDAKTCETKAGNNDSGKWVPGNQVAWNLVIPEKVNDGNSDYTVTSIGKDAFYKCNLTSVEIPNSVTSIGDYAFTNCSVMTSIVIGNSVTSIGEKAFSGCSSLTSVIIPNSVTSIGRNAFSGCYNLTSVIIPNSVTSIGDNVFSDCNSLVKSAYPNNLRNPFIKGRAVGYNPEGAIIEDGFIYGPDKTSILFAPFSLTDEYVIPEFITSIGDYAFIDCTSLTSVDIPNSVTSIGSSAFYGCIGLTSVIIPNSVTSIGSSVFYGCRSMTSVVIPNSVTSIGGNAFYGCSGLTSVIIPNSVTSIGEKAFSDCSGLTSVVIGNSVTSIGGNAFYGCRDLVKSCYPNNLRNPFEKGSAVGYNPEGAIIEDGFIYGPDKSSVIFAPLSLDGEYVIPNSVTSIGGAAFAYCGGLTSIEIPNTVTSIGESAFYDCSGLTSVVIGNSVTSIGGAAFAYCGGLTSVDIPNSVTSTGEYAFYECTGLTSVVIPNSVTSIGYAAFYGCSGLTSVVIGNSVTSIGEYAFYGCTGLIKSAYPNNLKNPFEEGYAVGYNPEGAIMEEGFIYGPEKTSIRFVPFSLNGEYIIPKLVTSIGNSAFYGCSGLTSVVIPNSVTSISESAFRNCSGLTSVEIPNSVTSIGAYAFDECSSLTSVEIPNSVTSIGGVAFEDCSGLTSVVIPNSVTSIGNRAFYGCTGLIKSAYPNNLKNPFEDGYVVGYNPEGAIIEDGFIYGPEKTSIRFAPFSLKDEYIIPNSVTSIDNSAFIGCSGLTSVEIPNSVTSIGDKAFDDCSGLTSVNVLAEKPASMMDDSFEGLYNKVTLSVPDAAVYAYLSTNWSLFKNIRNNDAADAEIKTFTDGVLKYRINPSDKTATVIGAKDNSNLQIPERFTDDSNSSNPVRYYVKAIGYKAFDGKDVKSIEFNTRSQIEYIGDYAFANTSLADIEIPATVKCIGNYALYKASKLNKAVLNSGLETIGEYAFAESTLADIEIPATVKSIENRAFYKTSKLNKAVLNSGLETVGDYAFAESALAETEIPETVKSIGNYAFYKTSKLNKAVLNPGLETVGKYAFAESALADIEIPATVKSIENRAFYKTSKLNKAVLNSGLETVGDYAFAESAMSILEMGSDVKSIGEKAFYNTYNLYSISTLDSEYIGAMAFATSRSRGGTISIYIGPSVKAIGKDAFENFNASEVRTDNLSDWYKIDFENGLANPLSTGNGKLYSDGQVVEKLQVPADIEEIKPYSFYGCKSLTDVIFPATLQSIGDQSFYGCDNISAMTFVEGNNTIDIADDAFNNSPKELNWGRPIESLTFGIANVSTLAIGNGITKIPDGKFKNLGNLTSITLGSSIQTVGDRAFRDCTSLTEVILPPSVETIGAGAFAGDSKLESIIMGHKVKTIGEKAFDGCAANTVSITAQTPPTAPNNTFSNYSGKLYLQGKEAKDAYYDAYTCWDRFSSYVMIDAEKINIDGADKISGKPGDTFQLTASIWPENATLPYIFWRSTNPEIATVDANGLVTLHADLDEVLTRAQGDADIDGTCTIIAETLYNDGPVAQVAVSNAGIDAVDSVAADGEGSIDYTRPYEVYNMSGLKVADSTEGLATGLYIIRQGNAAVKTAVR